MATSDPQTYSNIIKNIVIGKTGNVFIIDKEGNMIANIRPPLVEGRENFIKKAETDPTYATSAAVYKKMIAGGGIDIYAYETGDRICYYAPIKNTDGWSYGVVAPIREMFSSINNTVLGLGAAPLLCILGGIFLAVVVANSIENPISHISQRLSSAKYPLHPMIRQLPSIRSRLAWIRFRQWCRPILLPVRKARQPAKN